MSHLLSPQKLALMFVIFLGAAILSAHTHAVKHTQSEETDPVNDAALEKRQEMLAISQQLGVTCTYCHDTKNFRSSALKTYQIANEHIRITNWLNSQGFKGSPKVDCYVCHRGQTKAIYKMPTESKLKTH